MKPNLTSFLFSSLVLFAPLAAQATLTVNPNPIVPAGSTATVSYQDASRAGQTIGVVVAGGFPRTEKVIEITLDATGKGSAPWTAPASGWTAATFDAPGATTVRVTIQ